MPAPLFKTYAPLLERVAAVQAIPQALVPQARPEESPGGAGGDPQVVMQTAQIAQ